MPSTPTGRAENLAGSPGTGGRPDGPDRCQEGIDADYQAAINPGGGTVDADVAVLDTGIAEHSELNIQGGKVCVEKSPTVDGNGHGTHVAGTIAAVDNSEGVVGVAPGARLWAVKVLDSSGTGWISSVICGLDWVYKHRNTIDVVNMSLERQGRTVGTGKPCGSRRSKPLHKSTDKVVKRGGASRSSLRRGNGGVDEGPPGYPLPTTKSSPRLRFHRPQWRA